MNFMYLRTKKNPDVVWFSLIVVAFAFVTALYMGSSFLHPSSVVLGKPGDHTSGIMYLSWAHPSSPIPHRSIMTNYPEGESLRIPTTASSQVLSISHWTISALSNVVLGWNIMVFAGFMLSALVMFGFIRWLTQDTWISFFSAYAFTFTPYHVFASTGQIAGLYGFVFVAFFWQFLALWRKPSLKRSVLLGLSFGLSFYMDGYFILISFVMLAGMWLSSLTYSYHHKINILKEQRERFIALLVCSLTALLSLLPLLWIQRRYSKQIATVFDSARGDILSNAQTYSARLDMFLNPTHLLYIGLSVTMITIVGAGVRWFAYHKVSQKTVSSINSKNFVWWASFVLVILGVWFSLPPTSHIFGLTIYNPSKLIITLTPTWRIFGRLYSLIIVGVITLCALGLKDITAQHNKRLTTLKILLTLLLILDLGVYPLVNRSENFSYTNTPNVYRWLATDKAPHALAEYPIDDTMQGPYIADYLTFQEISNTPIVNSFLPNNSRLPLRRSIAGVNDLQTLPVLRSLGVDVLNVHTHNKTPAGYSGYEVAPKNPDLTAIFTDQKDVFSFIIKPGLVANHALVAVSPNDFQTKISNDGKATIYSKSDMELAVIRLSGQRIDARITAGFGVATTQNSNLVIVQNGKVVWAGPTNQTKKNIQFDASPDHPLSLYYGRESAQNYLMLSDLHVIN